MSLSARSFMACQGRDLKRESVSRDDVLTYNLAMVPRIRLGGRE